MKNDFREFYDEQYLMHNMEYDQYVEHSIKDRIAQIKDYFNNKKLKRKVLNEYVDDLLNGGFKLGAQYYVDTHSQQLADALDAARGVKKSNRKRINSDAAITEEAYKIANNSYDEYINKINKLKRKKRKSTK